MIPQQLQSPNIRFCRIQKGTKRPFEKDWTNKPYTYDEIKQYVPQENYGVLCGPGDLAVFDCDHEDMIDIVDKSFPKTLKVKTGSGGFHYYFFVPKLDKKIILNKNDKDHTHLGELQSHGTQVVGPGSLHPNGNTYDVVANFPIATLELDKVLDALKPYMDEVTKTVEEADYEKRTYSEIDNLSVASIWGIAGMKQSARGEYFGPHPIHGSGGGMNFWINTNKNTWHCFRCVCHDSKVITPLGIKKIQNLKVGDEVFGTKFQKNIIKKIFSRKAKEKIYKLNTYTPIIEITEGHPVYIASIKYQGKHLIKKNPSFSWKEISKINPKKDFLVIPKKHIPYLFKLKGFNLDKNFGELLGWYLAEGHLNNTHKTCIQLTLGLKSAGEKKAKRLCKLAKLQGATSKYYIYKDRGTILVQIHSKKLRDFILEEIGTGSNKKQLNRLITAPMEFLKSLINNYIEADGGYSYNKKQKRISSTSENLIRETQTILFKQGIPARYYCLPQKNNPKAKNPLHLLQWTLNSKHKSEFQDKNNLYLPIKIEKTSSNKIVYNIETQDNTFLLPYIVHNCNTGGGPLAAIAVKEGIIDCSDARPGYLRGDKAIDAIKKAEESYGLEIKEKTKVKQATKGFSKTGQAELFDELQPIYYDKAGLWWLWEDTSKKWKRVDDVDILNMVEDATGMDTVSSKMKTEIINALKQRGRRRKIKKMKPTWIQFRDKIVDILTGEEFEATPNYFVTNPIPWETHPENFENTPIMDKVFTEWVGAEHVKTLYEILAYSLIPSYPIHRIFCFLGGGMNGKCQIKGSKVLMANGTWKSIENIKIGDKVISPQSNGKQKIATVKEVHSRFEPSIYEVKENARKKRVLYTCAGNHEVPIIRWWTQRTSKDDSTPRIRKRRLFHYEAQKLAKMNNKKSDICSFTTTEVEFKSKDEKVDPYCLGAWLGDGCLSGTNSNITLGPKKKEIKEYFEKIIGFQANHKKKDGLGVSYRISQKSDFVKYLRDNNLKSHNKFIPKKCLLSSINFRLNLLAGLIDTDGFIQKITGAIYYTTKSKSLAEDIKDLIFSLGGYCEIRDIEKSSQTGFKGKYKELSIQFFDPLKIPLKTWKKTRLKKPKYDPRHIGINIVKKDKGEMVYGFELDANETTSQWYVTDNWMVTHNSCFLELLRRFVGHENCCSTELDTLLISRFEVTRLHKKLVCQMGETDFSEMKKTSILKKLSGGDLIGFEYKNKDPFEEKNYAKILISTNNLPTTTDKTIGFYRRWMIIDFPNTFSEKKDILEDIPAEEYKSLALKSIGILKDLLEERKFHLEGSIEERMRKYEDSSDPLQKFINTFCVEDLNSDIPKAGFEKRYNDWAKDNKLRQMSDMTIGRRMKSKGIESGRRYAQWLHDGKGGQMRVWIGIKWKDEWKEF